MTAATVLTTETRTASRRPSRSRRRASAKQTAPLQRTSGERVVAFQPGAEPDRAPAPPLRRAAIPLRDPQPARRLLDADPRPTVPTTQGTLTLVPGREPEMPLVPPAPTAPRVPSGDREWAGRFVHAAAEVSSGLRSATQLIRWTTPDVQMSLQRRAALAGRARTAGVFKTGKPFVRSLRISVVTSRTYEVTAVVGELDRFRAVALRMEDLDGRWRVTALEIG